MSNYNKVILLGNLTRDPEMRYTTGGSGICEFGLAVNRRFKGSDGQTNEETAFIDITAWGKQAETISQYTAKGDKLLVDGRLKFDVWDDKQSGQKRSKLSVVCENFQLMGGSKKDSPQQQRSAPAQRRSQPSRDLEPGDDDIPF